MEYVHNCGSQDEMIEENMINKAIENGGKLHSIEENKWAYFLVELLLNLNEESEKILEALLEAEGEPIVRDRILLTLQDEIIKERIKGTEFSNSMFQKAHQNLVDLLGNWKWQSDKKLRDYQFAAVEQMLMVNEKFGGGFLVEACGMGKTCKFVFHNLNP